MTKRANGKFARHPRDKYATVPEAMPALLPYLAPGTEFIEPCAGDGALIRLLEKAGHSCVWATDIDPKGDGIGLLDARALPRIGARNIRGRVITNPPWTRELLHPILWGLSSVWPCWFLFDADWAHTVQAGDLIWRCSRIVSVGRLKWFPGSKHVGFDNAAWYEFLPGHMAGPQFIPRGPIPVGELKGPDELRFQEVKARNGVAAPGPLFEAVQTASGAYEVGEKIDTPHSEGEKLNATVTPRGPSALDLLAKLRKAAGRPGPIPTLTEEVVRAKPD